MKARAKAKRTRRRGWFKILLLCLIALAAALYGLCVLAIVALRWIHPPTTSVQLERHFRSHGPYKKQYTWVPLKRISPALQHAVIAAEDARFYQHRGFDWVQVQKVIDQDLEKGKFGRGASTIDQQLVKNLFLSTSRSFVRKGVEFSLVPVMETVLPKNRILELYLNVIEWGPGVYGAEAAAEYWYHVPASQIGRDQAARLAAIIPAPLKRRPVLMNEYSEDIESRVRQMGW